MGFTVVQIQSLEQVHALRRHEVENERQILAARIRVMEKEYSKLFDERKSRRETRFKGETKEMRDLSNQKFVLWRQHAALCDKLDELDRQTPFFKQFQRLR